jgi:tetratricopeptide (TPR) repeat protein
MVLPNRGTAMKSVLTTRNISVALFMLTALFAVVFIIPNMRLAKRVMDAPLQNPYLTYIRYDELPYQPIETRGITKTEGMKFFELGMKDYVQKNYAVAIKNLKLAVQSESQAQWWLYLGVSHFMNHESAPAILALEKADTLSSPFLKMTARWYLAQAYLVEQKLDKAKPLLESVVASKTERSSLADSLLSKIQLAASQK